MAQTDLGKWMITNGGDYDPKATYEQLTMVMYDNSTYITLKTVTGITPADDKINYILMAKGFDATALSSVEATDTSGVLGTAGGKVSAQSLIDEIADRVMTQLIAKSHIINNGLTEEEGFVLDARQANPDIEGTLAHQIAVQNNNSSKWIFLSETTGKEKAYLPDDFNEILVSVVASVNNVIRYSILILKGELSAEEERSFRTGAYSSAQSYAQIVTLATSSYVYLNLYTNTGSDITTNSKVRVYYR